MIQRIRQFYRALTARINDEDQDYIQAVLEPSARQLFYAMHPADQVHALNVAHTASRLASQYDLSTADQVLLRRCALLHDVGRQNGDMEIWGKVFAVLVHHFLPAKLHSWQRRNRHSWLDYPGYALYVYVYHPVIGAGLLEEIGCPREAAIVRRHHAKPAPDDSLVLVLLRAADEQN